MAAEKKIKDNEEKATPTKKEKTVSKEESTEDAKKKKTSETKSKTKTKSAAVKSKATTVSKNRDETDSEKPKSRAASSAKKASPAKKSGKGSTAAKKSVNSKTALKNFAAYNGKTLVVVESPSKAKTLEKILGPKYKVLASIGHVCDLPKARLAIDIDNGFEPEYIQVRGKADLIKTLKGASAASKTTLLASDPDREGEAIAWHLASLLGIDPEDECRIRMHEITSNGVKSAVAAPDKINMGLVDAQQARRVLDRLVGYELSPLLWYKVKRGLSAGRVQSVALRIVCEREEEIENFVPEEYWNIDVDAKSLDGKRMYRLRVEKFKNKKIEIKNAEEALEAEKAILANPLIVDEFGTKDDK
ncbi:MAG: DNA topoisomerase I, partial [Synergistes sp.]|nr:DNA topoisomerase I [Synergistes sp.]